MTEGGADGQKFGQASGSPSSGRPEPNCGCGEVSARRKPWRIVFFGSTDFSLPALEALVGNADEVVLVVSPPPAPAGRGRKLTPTPVALRAEELGLPLLESKSVRTEAVLERLRQARPDLLVVAAFGAFLPKALLELCPYPPLNIHPSLLPRHRGAAPVNWSLISCDQEVGVSIIFLEEEMDAGPILSQRSFAVGDQCESAGGWERLLARAGAEDLLRVIADLKAGRARPRPQDQACCTINPLLCKSDGRVDFARPAAELAGLINGVDPWPGAQSSFQGKGLKIFGAAWADGASSPAQDAEPGLVLGLDGEGRLMVAAGRGILLLKELQPDGKKKMTAADFQRGYRPDKLGA